MRTYYIYTARMGIHWNTYISKGELDRAKSNLGVIISGNVGYSLPTEFRIGKRRFSDIDRAYFPQVGLPIAEVEKVRFTLSDLLVTKLEEEGTISSKLGDVTVGITLIMEQD